MAPENLAVDSVYQQLRSIILSGQFVPGTAIVVQGLAQTFGVSISPVRDALQRMIGARLIEAVPGGGFRLPAMTEDNLRTMYEWHHQLVQLAIRHSRRELVHPDPLTQNDVEDGAATVAATVALFERLGAWSRNPEHLAAIRMTGDRLHSARMVEYYIEDRRDELHSLAQLVAAGRQPAIERGMAGYHAWRMRHAGIIADLAMTASRH